MSLHHAISAQEGDYINEPITATVKFPKARDYKGRVFYTALLEDGQDKANVSCDVDLFSAHANKTVTFSLNGRGKGVSIKRKGDYNGTAQLAFGPNVSVSPAGQPTPAQSEAASHSETTAAFHVERSSNAAPASKQAHTATETALNGAELAKAWASLALATREAFNEAGLPEIADNAALRAPEWGALWWFGQRTVDTKPASATESNDEPPF